jgi:hypothetical protein
VLKPEHSQPFYFIQALTWVALGGYLLENLLENLSEDQFLAIDELDGSKANQNSFTTTFYIL